MHREESEMLPRGRLARVPAFDVAGRPSAVKQIDLAKMQMRCHFARRWSSSSRKPQGNQRAHEAEGRLRNKVDGFTASLMSHLTCQFTLSFAKSHPRVHPPNIVTATRKCK